MSAVGGGRLAAGGWQSCVSSRSSIHWGGEAHHPSLPRGQRVEIGTVGTLEEILFGPSRVADGTMNIVGALRRAMATTGYTELKEFQRIEVVVQ